MHRLPQERPTGRTPHDPAWPKRAHDRATSAPVNGMDCARRCLAYHQTRRPRRNHRGRPCDHTRKKFAHFTLCTARRCSRLALARPETEIPIAHCLRPAGSCMRDFRTPDGARNPSAFRSFERMRSNGGSWRAQRPSMIKRAGVRLRGQKRSFADLSKDGRARCGTEVRNSPPNWQVVTAGSSVPSKAEPQTRDRGGSAAWIS